VHGRAAYECPAEYSTETLDAAFDALWHAEKTHASAARAKRFTFITKEERGVSQEKLQEMHESYAAFDKDSSVENKEFPHADCTRLDLRTRLADQCCVGGLFA
jgi:hypothetical protein